MINKCKMDYVIIVICICSGLHLVTSQSTNVTVEIGKTHVISCALKGSFTYPEWRGPPNLTLYALAGSNVLNPALSNINRIEYHSNQKDLIIKNAQKSDEGEYKCSSSGLGDHSVTLALILLTTTSIKTSTRTTNPAVPTQIVTQSEQDGSKTVVIVVPSVVGGLFIIGVAVTVALVWKFRKNKTLHYKRSNHYKKGHLKNENKGRHLKRHPEYSEYIPTNHHGFSTKELYGYVMYSGQIEIKRNPLYSHHLDKRMNMSYVTNRGQYHYDRLYNGNQFLGYQMPSARADPLYTRRGHMIHPGHRYHQYSTNPRDLRTQHNTIVTDYSWNWN